MKISQPAGQRPPIDRKKTYRRPQTLSREKLEALAVVCDLGKTEPISCNSGPINS
jgi:hypothetical protein